MALLVTVKTFGRLHITVNGTVKTHIYDENMWALAPTVKATVKTFGPLQTYYPPLLTAQTHGSQRLTQRGRLP